ncbi:hypothetical protein ACFT5B_17795 [Luteimicrobium sp. NPDC057192]|uniref:hypothetical protein n=1 Tax=Luteimicrobium sp. NPDC057192 TaxID=3346042 RepID=UPI00362FADB2
MTVGVASGLVLTGCASGPGATVEPAASSAAAAPASSPAPALPSPTWTRTVGDSDDLRALARVAHAAHDLGYAYTGEATVLVRVPADREVPVDRTVGPLWVHFEQSRFTAASVAALKRQVGDTFREAGDSGENVSGGYGYEPVNDVVYVEGVLPKALTDAQPDPRLLLVPGPAARLDDGVSPTLDGAAVGGDDAEPSTVSPAGRPSP